MKIIGGLVCFRISDFWHRISHPADKSMVFLLHDAQQLLPHRHFFRQNPEITWSLFYGHNNLYHKGLNKPLCPENTVVQRSLSPCAWFSLVSVDTTLLCTAIVLQITASIFVFRIRISNSMHFFLVYPHFSYSNCCRNIHSRNKTCFSKKPKHR